MGNLQGNQIAFVTLMHCYLLYNSVLKTIRDGCENHSSFSITKFLNELLIIAGSLFSAARLLVSEIRQMILRYQHKTFSSGFHSNTVIQMTPNPGD
jgi:hypothetical protein